VSYYAAEVVVLGYTERTRWRDGREYLVEHTRWLIDDEADPTTRYELEHRCDQWERQGYTVRTYWSEVRHHEFEALSQAGWNKEA
jgi:hypothetical protein